MNRALEVAVRTQDVALCLIRKWWRPVTCIGVAASVWTYCVCTPLYSLIVLHQLPADGLGVAAVITAATGAFAVREWGKKNGTVADA
jgi:hypothetical protein